MGKPKFSLMDKTLNPEIVDGKMNAFVKVPYGIQVRLSHPLGKDGYGRVTVDGIPISRGKIFKLDMVIKADVLYLPVGEVAREFDREYTLELTGFKTAEGVPYPDCSFKIKTTAKSRPDPAFAENDEVALEAAREGKHVPMSFSGGLLCSSDLPVRSRLLPAGSSPAVRPNYRRNYG